MFRCWLRHNFSGCVWNFCDQHFRNSCFRFDRVISFDGVISFHVCSRGNAAFSLCTANPLRTFFLYRVTNAVVATLLLYYCLEKPLWMLYSACGIVWRHLERRRRGSLLLKPPRLRHICLCHCCLWYWILVTFFFYPFCRFYITDELLDPLKLCITSKRSKTVSCVLLRMRVCFMFGHNLFWIASRTV